ncbi:MAG: HDOD domain-containing protein [Pseudomonadota bacterium]|nr:histidine kinase [Pseudomonadales bacterium]MDY6922308.1 HDOD domain-containing protein [Pseudomonadota bacterium]
MNPTPILDDEHIAKILRGITVPPQPQVIVDIHMEQAMPNPDIHRIAKLISQDVGLSGTILKVVNSNLFGLKNRMASIEQAVQILGLQSIIRIMEGLSIKSEMDDETIVSLSRFWDSAMDIASVSATLARAIGYQAPDRAYCLGLFHNCGVPLLFRAHENYQAVLEESYAQPNPRVIDRENQYLKTNHAVVGYFVAKSWSLPPDLCEAIAEHHSVENIFRHRAQSYDHGRKTLLAILKMAEHICRVHLTLGNHGEDYEWQAIGPDLLAYVGLSELDFDDLTAQVESIGITGTGYYDH